MTLKNKGFSLIEILVATTLFATVAPFFFSAFLAQSRASQPQTRSTAAFGLAKEYLEEMKQGIRQDLYNHAQNPLQVTPPGQFDAGHVRTVGAMDYTLRKRNSHVPWLGSLLPKYRKAEVTVEWNP